MVSCSWLDFVLNWVAFVREAGVPNFFVGCLDDGLWIELQARAIPCIRMRSSLNAEEMVWGSDVFKKRVSLNFLSLPPPLPPPPLSLAATSSRSGSVSILHHSPPSPFPDENLLGSNPLERIAGIYSASSQVCTGGMGGGGGGAPESHAKFPPTFPHNLMPRCNLSW